MPSLVTKLPEERDPVICICFEREFEAERINADLIMNYPKDNYIVNIWPTDAENRFLNLMLISQEQPENQRLYKNLNFNANKFQWWVKHTEVGIENTKFKFAHIINVFGKDKVVKTQQRKLFVLNVVKYVLKDINNLAY